MEAPLVTIATYASASEAQLARTVLETRGIECFLLDEYLVAMDWLMSTAVGGVKLQVHSEDVLAAREILALDRAAWQQQTVPASPRCPRCGSDRFEEASFSPWRLLGAILLLGLPILMRKRRRKCASCGLR